MNLSIIIVSWNVKDKLRENLKALFNSESTGFSFEVFVIDNASSDFSVDMVAQEFPQVNLVRNSDNLGFAKANNQAIRIINAREQKSDFLLLLNPDMRVHFDTLKNMLAWFEQKPSASVASCRLCDKNDNIIPHVRRFPSFFDQLAIVFKLPHLFPTIVDNYLFKNFNYNQEAKVDSVRGSFFMIRNNLNLELDERYFIWFEEVDYCRELKKQGREVWYTPVATCLDYVGQSFNQVPFGKSQKYFRNSMLSYFEKWQPSWQYYLLKLAWNLISILSFVPSLLYHFKKQKS
ncbi:MAG: glycosyltransferase family 2 protein [Planctomycetes bacterium]|jgi:hypothetical protein|nr:glycosyltransferase family 2 protein [Planctomycetota bacterium]